ncbi:MAG: hypothetical protein FWD11_11585, partial [Micrococcales bacterium]|nr:hypothetical protein [Micrococcales bacterium]
MECPEGQMPDASSTLTPGAPLHCVSWENAYNPGVDAPWWNESFFTVMSGDAMRASGLPGSDEAATVLDAGGVVVNNAVMMSERGTVQVNVVRLGEVDETVEPQVVELPGAFVRELGPSITVSPAVADSFGALYEYSGEYVVTDTLSASQVARAKEILQARGGLVVVGTTDLGPPWGLLGPTRFAAISNLGTIGLLVAIGIVATVVSLVFARVHTRREAATLHAVGADQSMLRRFAMAQGVAILAVGVPLGLVVGMSMGVYQDVWFRSVGDVPPAAPVVGSTPLWPVQAVIVAVVLLAGLVASFVMARPPRQLVRRTID